MTDSSADSSAARSAYTTGIGLALVTIVLFSLKGIFAKFAYRHGVDAVSMMGLRMAFAFPFFAAVALWLRRGPPLTPLTKRDFLSVGLLGFVGYFLASWLDFLGLEYVTAGMERLLLFIFPTLVVLLSAFFFAKPIGVREVAALVTTYAGVALVVTGALGTGQNKNIVLGAAFVFASAIGYAVYLVFGSETIKRVGAMRFTAYAMMIAAVPAILMWVVRRPHEVFALPAQAYGWCLTLAVFSTVVPLFCQSAALKRIGANQFALLGALGPVCTILIGYIALGERLAAMQWAGAAAVVAGVMIVTLKPAK